MRKEILCGVVILLIITFGCSESSVVAEDFVESSDFNVEFTSSIPLEFTTLRFDSLITSQSDRLLFGGIQGEPFGDLITESFFLFSLRQGIVEEDLRYDSIILTLPMDGYTLYLDEESVRESVIVEQLPGELTYLEDENSLYNYSDIIGATDVPGNVLAMKEFIWNSDRIRDLEIRLPDTFGRDLFDRLEDEDEIFTDVEEANEYLRGLKVYLNSPDFVVGMAVDSIRLTLHTTDLGSSPSENLEFDFFIGLSPRYTKYTHQNVPESLQVEDIEDEVPSDSLNNFSYIIAGLGYASKINLTGVRELLESGDEFILAEAEIKLRWFEQIHEQYPQTLLALLVDGNNIDLANGQTFNFNLTFNEENGRDNYYTLNATDIVQFVLDQPIGREYYLFLTLNDFESSTTPVILGDQSLESEINIYTIRN